MAGSAALLIGGAILSKAVKPPKVDMPAPPKTDPAADMKKAEGAADQQRKRATAAGSQASTILTGPQGLGDVSADQQGRKNLLGY